MSKDVKRLISVDRRKCRFPDENDGILKIYSNYSKSACLMECGISKGLKMCGCIPWDFPHFSLDDPTCDSYGQDCFRR